MQPLSITYSFRLRRVMRRLLLMTALFFSSSVFAETQTDGTLTLQFGSHSSLSLLSDVGTGTNLTSVIGNTELSYRIQGSSFTSTSPNIGVFQGLIIDDADGDGVEDDDDNCPNIANADQTNSDDDMLGDACDDDDDNDGMSDVYENTHGLDSLDAADSGLDLDGDGLTNLEEFTLNPLLDPNDADTDGDGVDDALDNEPIVSNNACSGANVVFDQIVTTDILCGADSSITVVAPTEVVNSGHLRLVAPQVILRNGVKSERLTVTSKLPCEACAP